MITRFLFFFVNTLLECSGIVFSCNDYFSTSPVDKIKELPMHNVLYKTEYVDYDYREFGTYDEPQIAYDIKYDTTSHFRVILWGYVDLNKVGQTEISQIVDSVSITDMIVMRRNHRAERFSKKNTVNNNFDKPWKGCPLPMSVRNEIKEDFLSRMKYRKYHIKENERRITVYYEYKLYESD